MGYTKCRLGTHFLEKKRIYVYLHMHDNAGENISSAHNALNMKPKSLPK